MTKKTYADYLADSLGKNAEDITIGDINDNPMIVKEMYLTNDQIKKFFGPRKKIKININGIDYDLKDIEFKDN